MSSRNDMLKILKAYIDKKKELDPEIKKNYEERKLTIENCFNALEEYARKIADTDNVVAIRDEEAFALVDCFIETGSIDNFTPPLKSEEEASQYFNEKFHNESSKSVSLSEEEIKSIKEKVEEDVKKELIEEAIEKAKKKAYEREKKAYDKDKKKKEEVGQLSLFD